MFNRSPEVDELLKDPRAFALLAQIARRARWRNAFSADGLEIGEALIGDYESLGMTRAQYRTRLHRLEKWQQITARTTNKGTIAKLISSLVFDVNTGHFSQQNNQRIASKSPADNHQTTNESPLTNKGKGNKDNKEKQSSRIYCLTAKNKAIDERIEQIKGDKRNFEPVPGEFRDRLKPEFADEVRTLKQKKTAHTKELSAL